MKLVADGEHVLLLRSSSKNLINCATQTSYFISKLSKWIKQHNNQNFNEKNNPTNKKTQMLPDLKQTEHISSCKTLQNKHIEVLPGHPGTFQKL